MNDDRTLPFFTVCTTEGRGRGKDRKTEREKERKRERERKREKGGERERGERERRERERGKGGIEGGRKGKQGKIKRRDISAKSSMNDFRTPYHQSVIARTSLCTNNRYIRPKINLWDVFTPELDLMNKSNCTTILLSPNSSGFSNMYIQKPWSATNLIVPTAYN